MRLGGRRRDTMHDGAQEGERLALSMPFRLRGHAGRVAVYSGVNDDPRRTGFDLLGLPFDLALTRGYPTIRAAITYEGTGYRAYMGWIQLITNRDPATAEATTSVDLPPIHWGVDSPFFTFGSAPTFFDAPANPDHETEDWIAEAFLVVCPDVARTRRIAALLGFRWGYALRARRPTPLAVEPAGANAWDAHLPLLREQFPDWEFLPGFATVL